MVDHISFVEAWLSAWNDHDVDRVLAHFHDDAVFASPVAAQIMPGSDGVIRGKAALRAYWEEGLRRIPDLHFEVEAVFAGIDALVIQYRNQKGISVCEVLAFEGDLVCKGYGTYPADIDNPAGAR